MPLLNLNEIPRDAGEYFGVRCVHRYVVFDPNSPNARHVNTRLDRDYVSRLQGLLLSLGHPRILVHFEPEPMPGAVHEVPIETVTGQNRPGRGVHIPAANARPY